MRRVENRLAERCCPGRRRRCLRAFGLRRLGAGAHQADTAAAVNEAQTRAREDRAKGLGGGMELWGGGLRRVA